MNQSETNDFKLDCAIIRALKSGEMHSWFAVGHNFKRSLEELGERHDWIKKQGTEYKDKINTYNLEIKKKNEERKKEKHGF